MSKSEPKRIFITGGVRRLGLAIALGFAERGARLVLNYHASADSVAESARHLCLKAGASEVELLKADITGKAEEIASKLPESWNGIDVLINNAGVMPAKHKISELTEQMFRETLELNLLAPFALSRALADKIQDGGAIINIASLGGLQIWKERIDYNVSKSALITLTRALARELASRKITVNAVAPGAISVEDESVQRMGIAPEKIPFGSYGSGEDIMKAVRFLAYEGAYITGQTIAVDGGRTLLT